METCFFVYWDMRDSTKQITVNFDATVRELDRLALTLDQKPARLVQNIGDGQIYRFDSRPDALEFANYILQNATDRFPIAIVVGKDTLQQSLIGPQSRFFWRCKQITRQHNGLGSYIFVEDTAAS